MMRRRWLDALKWGSCRGRGRGWGGVVSVSVRACVRVCGDGVCVCVCVFVVVCVGVGGWAGGWAVVVGGRGTAPWPSWGDLSGMQACCSWLGSPPSSPPDALPSRPAPPCSAGRQGQGCLQEPCPGCAAPDEQLGEAPRLCLRRVLHVWVVLLRSACIGCALSPGRRKACCTDATQWRRSQPRWCNRGSWPRSRGSWRRCANGKLAGDPRRAGVHPACRDRQPRAACCGRGLGGTQQGAVEAPARAMRGRGAAPAVQAAQSAHHDGWQRRSPIPWPAGMQGQVPQSPDYPYPASAPY